MRLLSVMVTFGLLLSKASAADLASTQPEPFVIQLNDLDRDFEDFLIRKNAGDGVLFRERNSWISVFFRGMTEQEVGALRSGGVLGHRRVHIMDGQQMVGQAKVVGQASRPGAASRREHTNDGLLLACDSAEEAGALASAIREKPEWVLFCLSDFKRLPSLVVQLGRRSDPVSRFLWDRFSLATREQILADLPPNADDRWRLKLALMEELNRIIEGELIYEKVRFANVTISPETQVLLVPGVEGERLLRLNRLLIQDAYPDEFIKLGDAMRLMRRRIDSRQGWILTPSVPRGLP